MQQFKILVMVILLLETLGCATGYNATPAVDEAHIKFKVMNGTTANGKGIVDQAPFEIVKLCLELGKIAGEYMV